MLWRYIRSEGIAKWHWRAILLLTIAMWLIVDYFRIPGVLAHPQFNENVNIGFLQHLMETVPGISISYRIFFFIDFLWAFLLLLAIRKYVGEKLYENRLRGRRILLVIFTAIALVAYGLDIIENCIYLGLKRYPENIAFWKLIAYGIVFLVSILIFIYYTLRKFWTPFLRFVTASIYSLIILAIVGAFLPKATQMNSIVVNLYEHPFDLILLFLIAPAFAVVLAHYPSYIKIDAKQRDWYMSKIQWALMGVVFYKIKKKTANALVGERQDLINFLFRTLGILFYAALFYMLGYTSEINFDWKIQVSKMAGIMAVFGIIYLYQLKKIKDKWFRSTATYINDRLPGFYDGDNPHLADITEINLNHVTQSEECEDMDKEILEPTKSALLSIKKPVKWFVIIFGITISLHLVLVLILALCEACRYTELTVIWSLLCLILQMVSFVYYRTFRSVMRFVFYEGEYSAVRSAFYILRDVPLMDSKNGTKIEEQALTVECKEKYITAFFNNIDFTIKGRYFRFIKLIGAGALSNNVTFLQLTTLIGVINVVFFVLINVFSELSLNYNPILIILSGLFFYYGVFVVLTKHIIYYNNTRESTAQSKKGIFNFIVITTVVVLIASYGLGQQFSNNLFSLPLAARQAGEELTLDKYVRNLHKYKYQERYYVACYGGGMKSNAWTMTVLKKLYEQDNDFFKKTVGLSGASGGTIGLINMSAIINSKENKGSWSKIIEDISTENMLSLDLTHILGRDSFNALFVPGWDLRGKDRSSKAMERYAIMTKNDSEVCNPTPYRKFWKQLYNDNEDRFPILISNSTDVIGNGGMAVSVRVENEEARQLLYRGSTDLLEILHLDIDGKGINAPKDSLTLSYFDAASTSNRFPMISPAAKIETKGHFNDGGIYDNSGLLSVWKLFNAVNCLEGVKDIKELKQRNVFISIVNDKNLYIRERLAQEKLKIEVNTLNEHKELSAILSSVVATEMVPIYVRSVLDGLTKQDSSMVEFEVIYLPHRFTVADVKDMYGKQLDLGTGVMETDSLLYYAVKKNYDTIRKLVGENYNYGVQPIIEPPMSRVMADEAYKFMKTMLRHDLTIESLSKIKNGKVNVEVENSE